MNHSFYNFWTAYAVIEELVRLGVTQFLVCPGSRSTAFVLALNEVKNTNSSININVCTDERSAGFFALGTGKVLNAPAVVITTSGTAVANVLPSVIESSYGKVPLMVLSADRPLRLIDCGANQTIQQKNLFGNFVEKNVHIAVTDVFSNLETVLTTVDALFKSATQRPYGPVHLNIAFDEPLYSQIFDFAEQNDLTPAFRQWLHKKTPYTNFIKTKSFYDTLLFKPFLEKKGLLVVGGLEKVLEKQAVLHLAQHLNCYTFFEPGSGLTALPHTLPNLNSETVPNDCDWILYLGRYFVAKETQQYLQNTNKPLTYIDLFGLPKNETHKSISVLELEPYCVCNTDFETKNQTVFDSSNVKINSQQSTFIQALSTQLSSDIPWFVSNSLPIRWVTQEAQLNGRSLFANRGASGIDGILATAIGVHEAINKPLLLLIGDQALLHDLSSLMWLEKKFNQPIVIVVVNNNGGQIFSQLSIKESPLLKPYFVAPHHLSSFKSFFEPFKVHYEQHNIVEKAVHCIQNAFQNGTNTVVEWIN